MFTLKSNLKKINVKETVNFNFRKFKVTKTQQKKYYIFEFYKTSDREFIKLTKYLRKKKKPKELTFTYGLQN